MQLHKAVRHVTLAQANRTMTILEQEGHVKAAAEIACTADCLHFDTADSGKRPSESQGEEPVSTSVIVRLVVKGEVKYQKTVPASLFRFYDRKAEGLIDTGQDMIQESNSAAARSLFAEFHETRLGRAPDAVTKAALAGQTKLELSPSATTTPRSVAIGLIALTLIAFVFSLWQCQRSFNFIDSTYLMENLNLFAQGRVPYRDFFLVLPPMHYWIHGFAFRLTGGSAFGVACSGAIIQALTVLTTYWACQAVNHSPRTNLLFAIIPAVTGIATVCLPSYDCDAVLAATFAIGALLHAEKALGAKAWVWSLASGLAAGIAILIKINIGVPLMAGLLTTLIVGRLLFVRFPWIAAKGLVLGSFAVVGAAMWWLASHDALRPMIEQTIRFPAQMRLHPLANFIASLPIPRKHGYYGGWAVLMALLWCLLAFGWFAGTHRRPVLMLLPVALMAVCLGAMQSQGYGSVYGLGAMAALTLAVAHQAGVKLFGKRTATVTVGFALLFSSVSVVGDMKQTRLNFLAELMTEPRAFSESHLRGMHGHAATVNSFEAAVAWAKSHIRTGESAFWWPGTAPFYLATSLPCPLPNVQVYGDTGLSPSQALNQLQAKRVTWVLVDHSSALLDTFGGFSAIEPEFNRSYAVADHIAAATIYRLRGEPTR